MSQLDDIAEAVTEIRVDAATAVGKADASHAILTRLEENDRKQNGALAEVKRDHAVLKGQFGLARWVVTVVAIPVLLASFAELAGFVR